MYHAYTTLSFKVDFRRWGHLAMCEYSWWTTGHLKSLRNHLGRELSCAQSWSISTYRWGGLLVEPLLRSLWYQHSSTGEMGSRDKGAPDQEQNCRQENESFLKRQWASFPGLLDASLDPEKSDSCQKCKLKEPASTSAAGWDSGNVAVRVLRAKGNWPSLPILLLPTAWHPHLGAQAGSQGVSASGGCWQWG